MRRTRLVGWGISRSRTSCPLWSGPASASCRPASGLGPPWAHDGSRHPLESQSTSAPLQCYQTTLTSPSAPPPPTDAPPEPEDWQRRSHGTIYQCCYPRALSPCCLWPPAAPETPETLWESPQKPSGSPYFNLHTSGDKSFLGKFLSSE